MPKTRDTRTSAESTDLRVARVTARQVIVVAAITAISGVVVALVQNRDSAPKNDTASTASSPSKSTGSEAVSTAERLALYRLIADRLEEDLKLTAAKGEARPPDLTEADIRFRSLRRSIFLNMMALQADELLLRNGLDTLAKRGYSWVDAHRARLLAEFPHIKVSRLRFLEDVVIPSLQKAIEQHSPVAQSLPSTSVALPEDARIIGLASDEPDVTFSSMAAVEDEVRLLKAALAQ
jgi:hypothetical protein